jgi:hypothetical protein
MSIMRQVNGLSKGNVKKPIIIPVIKKDRLSRLFDFEIQEDHNSCFLNTNQAASKETTIKPMLTPKAVQEVL